MACRRFVPRPPFIVEGEGRGVRRSRRRRRSFLLAAEGKPSMPSLHDHP
jgi:hypothetical protein